jgi:guanylate kinase
MTENRTPMIIVVSAPSGCGKTTIVNNFLAKTRDATLILSYTTRKQREEKDAEEYVFISEEEFKNKIDNGEFIEWEQTFGNYYGTSEKAFTEEMQKGNDVILSIDVKGAKNVKNKYPESVSIFIMPPSVEELEERLRKRDTDDTEQIRVRLNEAKREIEAAEEYDYLIINNNLTEAVEELEAIVETERKNRTKTKTK